MLFMLRMEGPMPCQLWLLTKIFLIIMRPSGMWEVGGSCMQGDYISEKKCTYGRLVRNSEVETKIQSYENMELSQPRVHGGALTQKDVKNEGCSVYVYENK